MNLTSNIIKNIDKLIFSITRQVISSSVKTLLVVKQIEGIKARLSVLDKTSGTWQEIFSVNAIIGKNGVAKFGTKHEGDNRTPEGLYNIKTLFGFLPNNSIAPSLDYIPITEKAKWIDGSGNKYNTFTEDIDISHEKMNIPAYKYGAVIEYNTDNPLPEKGSAIFLHIYLDGESLGTAGCVAVTESNLIKILSLLNKQNNPSIFIINKEES